MAEIAEELLPIDLRLRFALFGVECALGVSFTGAECERVFRDAADNQVSAKRYVFFESPRLAVTGRVDEYEPNSIWLRVEGLPGCGAALRRAAEGSEFAAFRLRQSLAQAPGPERGAATDSAGCNYLHSSPRHYYGSHLNPLAAGGKVNGGD